MATHAYLPAGEFFKMNKRLQEITQDVYKQRSHSIKLISQIERDIIPELKGCIKEAGTYNEVCAGMILSVDKLLKKIQETGYKYFDEDLEENRIFRKIKTTYACTGGRIELYMEPEESKKSSETHQSCPALIL